MTEKEKKFKSYKTSKAYIAHEERMMLMKMMAADPEMKYFIGMAAGAGAGAIGFILTQIAEGMAPEAVAPAPEPKDPLPYFWLLSGGPGGLAMLALLKSRNWDATGMGMTGHVGNILALGGTGFAGTCAMILILKSIFNGTDLGELLQGVGEIIPF